MAKANCKCKVCGKEYHFCLKCNEHKPNPLPRWHVNYCDENCKRIFEIAVRFGTGSMTKEEAEKELQKCDTTNFDSFEQDVKDSIKAIQKKDKTSKPFGLAEEKPSKKEDKVGE